MARLQGYPSGYGRASGTQHPAATACHALLLHRSHTSLLFKALQQNLGPELTCADLALRLRGADRRVAVAAGSVMFWAASRDAPGVMLAQPPASFISTWRRQLLQLVNTTQQVSMLACPAG